MTTTGAFPPWTAAPRHPLREPAFRWFAGGRFVSLLGSSMTPVALAFAVLHASGNERDLGVVLAAQSVPLVVFLLLGGAVADRFSRSAVLRISHAGAGLTQGAVAALLISGHYSLAPVAALEVANGALSAFTRPALVGIVPQLVARPLVMRANAVLSTGRNVARILGPSIAGLLVASAGGGWAIAVDALSYLLAAGCLAPVRLPRPVAAATSVLADIRAGWEEFRSRTWVWVVVASFTGLNAVQVGVWGVLGPIIAKETFGAPAWGAVVSANAVGLLVTALLMYRVRLAHLLRAGQLGVALTAVPLVLLGLQVPVAALVATSFLAGMGGELFGIAWETSLQEHVPGQALSRVASYDALGSFVGMPVGQLAVVPLALAAGNARVAVGGGVLYGVLALAALASRSVRDLRHEPPGAAAGHTGEREGAVDPSETAPRRRPEPDEGGDPACWLHRVCPACGRLADEDPPTRCPGCGQPIEGE